ncbi:oxysterol-binding protein-related protein 10-like [Aplochiton taeniatus]
MNPSTHYGNPARRLVRGGSLSLHDPVSDSLTAGMQVASGLHGVPGAGASGGLNTQARKRHLEGVLSKYTNLLQGWQNRYFVLEPEVGQLQYYVNEHSKSQHRPRGALPLIGASVASSDELPHMFTIHSANGDGYKLRASDAQEQQLWMSQLQLCARRHSDSSAKRLRRTAPHGTNMSVPFASGGKSLETVCHCSAGTVQRTGHIRHTDWFGNGLHITTALWTESALLISECGPAAANIITVTHHKSPTAGRRARNRPFYPSRLQEVKEVMSQAEGQQRNLVHSIESLPPRGGPLSSLDEDLLLLKATSAATLSCLGECLSMLQLNVSQALTTQQPPPPPPPQDQTHTLGQQQAANHIYSPSHVKSPGESLGAPAWTQSPGRCLGENLARSQSQSPKHSRSPGRSATHSSSQNPLPSLGHRNTESPSAWSRPPSERQVRNGVVSPSSPAPGSPGPPTRGQRHSRDRLVSSESLSLSLPHTYAIWMVDMKSSKTAIKPAMVACQPTNQQQQQQGQEGSAEAVDPRDEATDTEDNEEEDLGVLEDQRSIILHLLSQLKLGMDLTRVVLPTFILEKRSLLEMYANFMAHPDMFLSITSGATAEERMVHFVEYYLTAFHEGRKGAVAKKPYNPILGESFRCSWDVPRQRVRPLRTNSSALAPNPASTAAPASGPAPRDHEPRTEDGGGGGGARDCYRVRFVAEQVSHHPPVSGFYCECKERRMCVNTHVWTKSKFMGMSIGVSMVGEGVLYLMEHDEEYVFTLPCAYARSILTVPWVELGGKVSISCAKSGYSASVTFHTKPFYGGKVHRVTAEVKHNPTGAVVCKAQGEWNGTLEFTYSSGETKVIDTARLPIIKKKIRPLEKQGPYESRYLWQHVTSALKSGNIDLATEQKHRLEERQRSEGKQRAASKTPWKPKYFIKEGEGWVYHNPLWKTH